MIAAQEADLLISRANKGVVINLIAGSCKADFSWINKGSKSQAALMDGDLLF